MAAKLSLWVRSVPPAVLLLLAMMAVFPLVCGLTLSGFGRTMLVALLLLCGLALVGLVPNLDRCDAFDAYGVHGPVERACFGPRRC